MKGPMELYQLRIFLTIARTGNLTRAAERLNASQPAVSSQIKALEEELGVTLFARTPRGMELTQEGRILSGSGPLHAALGSIPKLECCASPS
jgi:DNA-binding transcriptional LysR family regulator